MGLLHAKRRTRFFLSVVFSFSFIFFPQTSFAVNVAFTYDAAGRLLTAQYGDGQHIAYSYDKVGNMTQELANGSSGWTVVVPVLQLLLDDR